VKQSRHRGIWISEDSALEQIELLMGEEKRRNKNRRRTERRMEAMSQLPGVHHRSDLRAIFQAQNGRCYYCGVAIDQKSARRDHLEPLNAARSSNWPSNIVFACFPCNRDKSDMSSNAYWRLIEKRLGSTWVKDQKACNAAVTEIARQLTKQRKAQLAAHHLTAARSATRPKRRAAESGR
jgi:5-methylcytosine-specific restriction endonuclease McrA